jgi:hypothetical protein
MARMFAAAAPTAARAATRRPPARAIRLSRAPACDHPRCAGTEFVSVPPAPNPPQPQLTSEEIRSRLDFSVAEGERTTGQRSSRRSATRARPVRCARSLPRGARDLVRGAGTPRGMTLAIPDEAAHSVAGDKPAVGRQRGMRLRGRGRGSRIVMSFRASTMPQRSGAMASARL